MLFRSGLDYAVKKLAEKDSERAKKSLHISGEELLMGLRSYALDQFGPLAITVLGSWGIRRCGDFGEIVFKGVVSAIMALRPIEFLKKLKVK